MDDEGDPGLLPPGVTLINVVLDELIGVTVVEIDEDAVARVLGPVDSGMYVFPSREGIANFLASGEPHSLAGRLDEFDAATEEPAYEADFARMLESDADDDAAAMLWMECLLVVDGCGVVDPSSVEDAMKQVEAVTTLREDFEPGYQDRDYWQDRDTLPVQITLPGGTGVTIVALDQFGERSPAFLGDQGEVALFHDPADLVTYIHAEGTDAMRAERYWPRNPPECEPRMTVDVRQADPGDLRSDAYVFLRALATVLTKREGDLSVHKMSKLTNERRMRRAVDTVAEVLREVNGRVTWR